MVPLFFCQESDVVTLGVCLFYQLSRLTGMLQLVLVFMEARCRCKQVVVEKTEPLVAIGLRVSLLVEVFSHQILGVFLGVFMRWFVE